MQVKALASIYDPCFGQSPWRLFSQESWRRFAQRWLECLKLHACQQRRSLAEFRA
jgi:hypothetical protein